MFVTVGDAFIREAGGTIKNSGGTLKLCKERKERYSALFDDIAETITAYEQKFGKLDMDQLKKDYDNLIKSHKGAANTESEYME